MVLDQGRALLKSDERMKFSGTPHKIEIQFIAQVSQT